MKKRIKFRTTTNRIKIAFSANNPLAKHKTKMCEQNAITKFALQIVRVALNLNAHYSMYIFKNFSGEHAPGSPKIIFVSLFASNFTLPEKIPCA